MLASNNFLAPQFWYRVFWLNVQMLEFNKTETHVLEKVFCACYTVPIHSACTERKCRKIKLN